MFVAQTNLQLYAQLEPSQTPAVAAAYGLAAQLFTGQFRASGKPFLAHLVGTASLLAGQGRPLEEITTGLLHAAYDNGDFGATVKNRREEVRAVIGELAEAYLDAYANWDSDVVQRIAGELTTAEAILRHLRLARGARPELGTPYMAPQTETERELATLLGELLRVEPVGRNDSFYDLGGHSLLAAQVLSLIEERLHVQLSPIVLFRGPFTVAELAQTVHESRLQGADEADLLQVLSELEDLSDEEVRALLLIEGS